MSNDERTYKITRFRCHDANEVVATGLTREQAEAHCEREDSHGEGWFDGWNVENPTPGELVEREASDRNLLNAVVAVTALTRGAP